jgi:hypothetical protein
MLIQHPCTHIRNVGEPEFPGEKAADRRLVGGIEHRAGRAAPAGRVVAEPNRRKPVGVGRLELEPHGLREVESPCRPVGPLGIGQGVLDRQPHVGRTELGDHRPVDELHE